MLAASPVYASVTAESNAVVETVSENAAPATEEKDSVKEETETAVKETDAGTETVEKAETISENAEMVTEDAETKSDPDISDEEVKDIEIATDSDAAEKEVKEIEAAKIVLPKPVRDGYEFVEWNTRIDGEGESYQAGDEIEVTPMALYAIWREA